MLHFGHIHKPIYEGEDNIVYPGSMISFGFDELGERGVLDVEIIGGRLQKTFIKLDERVFEEIKLDVSEMNSGEELVEQINSLDLNDSTMYKLILTREQRV
ncbi:MAG: hypothetical protein FWC79_08250 [Oscillospiraceae bacterium]|nr:hypothetical protein [Oscillospiraceae bacterium]